MKVFEPVLVAFSMFSRLNVRNVEWSERNMRYAMCAFPLVGVVQSLFVFVWTQFCVQFEVGPILWAAQMAVIPVWVNGGIHIDGLCDTADALASHAERPRKLEILSDPHLGAFGAIALACHMLILFGLFCAMPQDKAVLRCFACVYPLSRALSGFAVVRFPSAKPDGLARLFSDRSAKKSASWILFAMVAVLIGCMIYLCGELGVLVALAGIVTFFYYRWMAIKEFGGITGDLAGWFLQKAEIIMLAALVIGERILWS